MVPMNVAGHEDRVYFRISDLGGLDVRLAVEGCDSETFSHFADDLF